MFISQERLYFICFDSAQRSELQPACAFWMLHVVACCNAFLVRVSSYWVLHHQRYCGISNESCSRKNLAAETPTGFTPLVGFPSETYWLVLSEQSQDWCWPVKPTRLDCAYFIAHKKWARERERGKNMIAAASSEKRGVLLGEEGIARMKNRSQLQGSPKRFLSLALRHDFARRKSSVFGHGSKFHETEDGGPQNLDTR